MAIPPSELSEIDLKILKYINKFDSVSKNQIASKFPQLTSLDFRLSRLAEVERSTSVGIPVKNSSYILEEFDSIVNNTGITHYVSKNSFHITDYGRNTLLDFDAKNKSERKEFWRKSILTPVLVSVAINMLWFALQQLWPLILQLVKQTP